jgi:uncharacterized RDD family membrane protein YckC
MKSLSHNLRLLALFGAFAVVLGLLRADDTATDKSQTTATAAPAAAATSESIAGGSTATEPQAPAVAPKPDEEKPALRSLTEDSSKAATAEETEPKEEPAEMSGKNGEENAPEAKTTEPAPEVKPTPDTPETKHAKKAKKGKTVRVNSQEQIPFQDIVVEEGQTSREAVSVGASTTVKGEVTQSAVAIFGSNRIATKARVGGEAVAVFGNMDIDGEVGKAVAIFGNLKLGPNAVVHGETVVVFGSFDKDPAAHVEKLTPIFAAPVFGAFGNLNGWFHSCLFQGRLLAFNGEVGWAWGIAAAHLLLYVLISLLFGKGTVRSVETLERRPGMSLLSALLVFLLTPLVIVILAIGTVTAVLIPVLIIGLFFISYYGRTVMHAWFGRLFARFLPSGLNTPVTVCVLMGGVIISLLYCVPLLGILMHSIIGSIGLGAAVLSIAESMKREPKTGAGPVQPVSTKPKAAAATIVPPASVAASPAAPVVANVITTQPATPSPVIDASLSSRPAAPTAAPAAVAAPESVVGGPLPVVTPEPAAVPPVVLPIIPAAPTFSPMPPTAAPAAVATPESVVGGPLQTPASAVSPTSADSSDLLPRAGFWLRMGAMGIDFVLVILSLALLSNLTPDWAHVRFGPWVLLLLATYAAVLWKHRGTTIGGIICRIQVVRTDGQPIDWTTAIVRGLGCILSAFAAGLGFIWIAVDRDQESWHDKIAGTAVVRVPKSRPLI